MTAARTLLIRCDAGVAIGTGHAMRCLALAQAWQGAGGSVAFAMAEATSSIEARLRIGGIKVLCLPGPPGSVEDSSRTCDVARQERAEWVVVDGYRFGSAYQRALRAADLKVLFVDDDGNAAPYCADLVLNQNVHASEGLYPDRAEHTRLLLGPRYILLRREFAFWRKRPFEIAPQARRILVTMGGSDPDNVTEHILRVLLAEPNLELTAVVGGSNPHLASIEQLVEKANCSIRLLKDVSDMAAVMVWADLAVAGAGTTSWEMCMLGLPAALCVLAPNQERIANELARLGAAADLGDAAGAPADALGNVLCELIRSQAKRTAMSARGREIVDGLGPERVLAFLWGDPVLRRTIDSDSRNFWEWMNDAAARTLSLAREPISWERHIEWFRARLSDPQSILYTALNRQGHPVGMVRYQVDGTHAVLSIIVGAASRGKGNGRKMLFLSTEELFRNSRVAAIHALVRISNQPSIRLFEGAGFHNVGVETVQGSQAIRYVLHRSVLDKRE
jgi:UDP-2,4-diacetamido-2,4,6-trideoxy-beta-L-altropyranose hydrolase